MMKTKAFRASKLKYLDPDQSDGSFNVSFVKRLGKTHTKKLIAPLKNKAKKSYF